MILNLLQSPHVLIYYSLDCFHYCWQKFSCRKSLAEKDFTEKLKFHREKENSSWDIALDCYCYLCSKYFLWKEKDFKVKESCFQTSCEYLYFVVGWRGILVPISVVWIKDLADLWTCEALQNFFCFWCEWHSQLSCKWFWKPESKKLQKNQVYLHVQGQHNYWPLIFCLFVFWCSGLYLNICKCEWLWLAWKVVQDYLKLCLRHLRLHTRIRDIALEILLQFFLTAGTGFLHHHCMMESWYLEKMRTDFIWLCDCYNLEVCDQDRSLLWTEVLR